jgi:hypothetical protein
LGLRGIEWAIFGLKIRESWGLQGVSAFRQGEEFGMHDGWHKEENADGGFGIRIRSLVSDLDRQCAGFLVIRKRA